MRASEMYKYFLLVCVRFASIPFIRLLRFVLLLHNADIMEIISLL